tara:strand:- start:7840 stop:8148 length:309 start_codon:yes stop_codon:yes gene_type:complete
MTVLNTYHKQPNETKRYRIDYSLWLGTDELLETSSVPVITALNSTDAISLVITVDGFTKGDTAIEYVASAGTNNVHYNVEFTITTSKSQTVSYSTIFRLRDL